MLLSKGIMVFLMIIHGPGLGARKKKGVGDFQRSWNTQKKIYYVYDYLASCKM